MSKAILTLLSNPTAGAEKIEDIRFFSREDGSRGLTTKEQVDEEPTEALYFWDDSALHVPVRYLEGKLDATCPADASLKEVQAMANIASAFGCVTGGGGSPIDVDFRLNRDKHGIHCYWSANSRAKCNDAFFWAEGKKFVKSTKSHFEAHMDGMVLSESADIALLYRLNAAIALGKTFEILESVLPLPFMTLDSFMTEQQEVGLLGDAGGKSFVRYLLENVRLLESPGYPRKSKTSFYKFLRSWTRVTCAFGAHFSIVRSAASEVGVNRHTTFRPNVSIMP
ncbi:hypothetical protein [Rhodoferax koreensis]|nr:hypothetical protein [Rhodoferax koreense]